MISIDAFVDMLVFMVKKDIIQKEDAIRILEEAKRDYLITIFFLIGLPILITILLFVYFLGGK